MTVLLGVEINLSKSLTSEKSVCEFAKRLVGHDEEFTPIGASLLLQVAKTSKGHVALLFDLMNKGMAWSSISIRSLFEGHPTLGKWFDRNRWNVLGPYGVAPQESSLLPSLEVDRSLKYSEFLQLLARTFDSTRLLYAKAAERRLPSILACNERLRLNGAPWIQEYRDILSGHYRMVAGIARNLVKEG